MPTQFDAPYRDCSALWRRARRWAAERAVEYGWSHPRRDHEADKRFRKLRAKSG